jgi:hypothetical protein
MVLEALRGCADTIRRDGRVDYEELYIWASLRMEEKMGETQVPDFVTSPGMKRFYVSAPRRPQPPDQLKCSEGANQ